jgi:hypothetical protein
MADTDQEAQWRAEVERMGRAVVHDVVFSRHDSYGEPKRQFALRWLREKEKGQEKREKEAHWYSKWTFYAAVAAMIIIGVMVTRYWHG